MAQYASLYSQVIALISRLEFESLVHKHNAEKHAKGFTCWDQFVAMLFAQLANAKSLREICYGLASFQGKVRHLGLTRAPNKSTLAYANEHRPQELFRDLFLLIFQRCRQEASTRNRRFKFKNPLLILDSTTIPLCLGVFPWAAYIRTKGAVKLHLLLDHDSCLPTYVVITDGKKGDTEAAYDIPIPKGAVVVVDRGYNDFSLYNKWIEDKAFFVTRQRSNAVFEVVSESPVLKDGNVVSDQMIKLTGECGKHCLHLLRRVVIKVPETGEEFAFITNFVIGVDAATIAEIYKERWRIEEFFKALKQNFRIKTFVGTSANALAIQIWTALIAIILLKYLKMKSSYPWSLSNLVVLLRLNLLVYRCLPEWLDRPMEQPPEPPRTEQGELFGTA